MAQWLLRHAAGQVRNTGDAADFISHMIRSHRFAGRTHTDRICAQNPAHPDLGRTFIGRAGKLQIYALLNPDSHFCRTVTNLQLQRLIVDMAHIRETRPQLLRIRPQQKEIIKRALRNMFQMIKTENG